MRAGGVLSVVGIALALSCGGRVASDGEGIPSGSVPAAGLSSLSLSTDITPSFDPAIHDFGAELTVPSLFPLPTLSITASPAAADARVTVDGIALAPGVATEIPVSTGKSTLDVVVARPGAPDGHYTIRLAVHVQEKITYLKASNTLDNIQFGNALALDGDTLVVSQHWDKSGGKGVDADPFDTSTIRSGAVFVFTRQGGTWAQQAYIKPPNTHAEQDFGVSVALKGDLLVVGAPGDTSGTGAAFVYRRTGSVWALEAQLAPVTPQAYGRWGQSVAIGQDTIAIGGFGATSGAGVADLFVPNGTAWTRQEHMTGGPYFGIALALTGDTLAIAESAGVDVYTRTGGTWTEATQLTEASVGIRFAYRLALDGDTLVAGAAAPSGDSSGAVVVFRRNGTTWSREAFLQASNARNEAAFGFSIALAGDTLAVGAYGEQSNSSGFEGDPTDASTFRVGAAYVFSRSGTTWTQRAYVKASNPRGDAYFGSSIALSPTTLVVGSDGEGTLTRGIDGPQSPFPAGMCGAAYVY